MAKQLIRNDGYVLRYKAGKFLTVDSGREVSRGELRKLNAQLEQRRAETYREKYGDGE